jgi:mono/diheme cytochrome c family protein
MNPRPALVSIAAAALALLVACSARRSEPLRGPLPMSDATWRGHVAFDRHCDKCHQGGEGGLGPALNDKRLPDFAVRFQVRRGLGAMPAFSREQLPDDELNDILCYLKALRNH